MENVVIYETGGQFPRVITAQKARWDGQNWALEQGVIHKYSPDGLISYQGKFQSMTIHVEQALYNYYQSQKSPLEMTTKELKEKIRDLKKSGVETDSLTVAYHMKFSMPLACLIFALVGIALVLAFITNPKELWGVIVAVLMALLSVGFYFFVMATFRSLARAGKIMPLLGAWGPNFIYGLVAIILLIVVRRRNS
jgi:lipopolysaccharide export LptBFGC system permease protein LptF